jgi:hypothetical protein
MPEIQYAFYKRDVPVIPVLLSAVVLTGVGVPVVVQEVTTSAVFEVCDTAGEYALDSDASRWVKFQCLAQEWRQQSGALSSVTAMAMLRPYQQIIGMGRNAVPFILAELKAEGDDPDQWFWALSTIAEANGLNPPEIQEEDQGDYQRMAQIWINWAGAQGYAG